MHDTRGAEPLYKNQFELIGYLKEVSEDLWLPIDASKATIAGPSTKQAAVAIVQKNDETPIQPTI